VWIYPNGEAAGNLGSASAYVGSGMAFVLHSNLTDDTAPAVIQDVFKDLSESVDVVEWKYFSWDQPAGLPADLERAGFSAGDEEALVVLPLDDLPGGLGRTPRPDIEVRIARGFSELADAESVLSEVWGRSRSVADAVRPAWAESEKLASVHTAYINGTPCSFGRVHFPRSGPFASLWSGATLPDFRSRGAYTALVASRAAEALERGYRYLTVDANPQTSLPILRRLGFVEIGRTRPFAWEKPT
jgi:ribosomal protein S18 acetylase RimI-like enzyme